ncbi:hypothetical protein Dimus_008873 [Dionaea muscipula]
MMQSPVQFHEPGNLGSDSHGSTIDNHFSLLHLSAAAATTTPPPAAEEKETDPSQVLLPSSLSSDSQPCRFCSENPLKRPAPSSSAPSQPKLKKPFTPQTAAASPAALHLPGFNVLKLPSAPNLPPLRRCNSTPLQPPPPAFNINNALSPESLIVSGSGSGSSSMSKSPENLSAGNAPATPPSPVRASGAQLPPLPRPLCRSSSDPTPCQSHLINPPSPAVDTGHNSIGMGPRSANSRSPSPRCIDLGSDGTGNESPASKRLRRMSARMIEMRQWFDEIMTSEDDDDQGSLYQASNISTHKDSFCCSAGGGQLDKSGKDDGLEQLKVLDEDTLVSAERDGDSTVVHLKCPCGSGYHILLSGQSCYYKLL